MRVCFLIAIMMTITLSFNLNAEEADAPKTGPGDEGTGVEAETGGEDAAFAAFEDGKALFNTKNYKAAAQKFREANELRPSWKLLFNIGQSEAAAKRHGLALEAFETYLTLGGDDVPEERRGVVMKEINRLRPIVGYLSFSAPLGTTVIIDEFNRGETPLPGPVGVASGISHRIQFLKNGEPVDTQVAKVAGGQTVVVSMQTIADNEPTAPGDEPVDSTPPAPTPVKKRSPLVLAGFTCLGAGAAMLIAGAVTGGMALSKYNTLDEKCPNKSDCDERDLVQTIDKLSLTTDILLPLGGVVAAAGAALVLVGLNKTKSESGASIAVTPTVGRNEGGLFLEGRF